ncbi:alpha/beta hydrolase [Hymenobacter swuensis]|uniref:Esterase n=1 Tax=Hymenobacter swuensis DY53 TaxID=1227739 RepID=W8F3G5_9BACT|nr:alpha/beta hydrolase-fold protein [Hymenobacter swuensis]AHJ99478.1 hypothetical protein Hsw_3883 [Hymenobacter swuensis DY53]
MVLWLLTCSFSSVGQLPTLHGGTLQRLPDFPSRYVQPRAVDVWLPEGYVPTKKYATLYMHDGQMLFDNTTTWNLQEWHVEETMSRLLREQKIRDCIVVAVWNNGAARFAEYFPQKALTYLPAALRDTLVLRELGGRPQADNYLCFLVRELKPYIDAHFATRPEAASTFVAGSSMGGLISLYAVCEYPRVFGGAACLSTHWTGSLRGTNDAIPQALRAYLLKSRPSPATHRLYFDYGTAGLDAAYKAPQLLADALLRQAGYTTRNLLSREFAGADHSEKAWSQRLALPLEFLLAPVSGIGSVR